MAFIKKAKNCNFVQKFRQNERCYLNSGNRRFCFAAPMGHIWRRFDLLTCFESGWTLHPDDQFRQLDGGVGRPSFLLQRSWVWTWDLLFSLPILIPYTRLLPWPEVYELPPRHLVLLAKSGIEDPDHRLPWRHQTFGCMLDCWNIKKKTLYITLPKIQYSSQTKKYFCVKSQQVLDKLLNWNSLNLREIGISRYFVKNIRQTTINQRRFFSK